MSCPPHKYGVKPYGQLYLESCPEIRTPGLGHLAVLSDELLVTLLYALPAAELQRLGMASKALYVFCHYDELWKALTLECLEGGIQSWHSTWRETYLQHTQRSYQAGSHKPIVVHGLYSDLLHQPWLCANMEPLPEWLEVENVDRRSGLSLEEFQEQYEGPNRPVIITDVASSWPAFKKWTRQYLLQAFAGREVIVGNAPMRLGPYLQYADNNQDEMPLYMFDKAFALAAPQLADDYEVPPYFRDDLFEALGEDERPDYRWLIIGPKHSGSSFHIDPNATSAWNAVITGSKKWILYPPGCTPPGIHVSPDGADVAAPVSLMEWFLNFYNAARKGEDSSDSDSDIDPEALGPSSNGSAKGGPAAAGAACPSRHALHGGVARSRARAAPRRHVRPMECIVNAGELLFVPRGWFHMVLNLDESVAITQNFVSPLGLEPVLAFLRTGTTIPGLVSGCEHREDLYRRFLSALQEKRPEVLAQLEEREAKRRERAEREGRLGKIFREAAQQKKCTWPGAGAAQSGQAEAAGGGVAGDAAGAAALVAADGAPATFTFGFSL